LLALLFSWQSANDFHPQFEKLLQCFLQFCSLLAVLICLHQWHFSYLRKAYHPLVNCCYREKSNILCSVHIFFVILTISKIIQWHCTMYTFLNFIFDHQKVCSSQ
jgi:hypothetical protein